MLINTPIFMIMFISEQEKKQILSKYSGDTSDELLTHLKRHHPVTTIQHDWMNEPIKFIQVGDKSRLLKGNKKWLVGELSNSVRDEWIHLSEKIIRRTVKKYLDGIQ
jgi:hypothetical protein